MTREEGMARILKVMRDVFDTDHLQYEDGLAPGAIAGWDSLKHVRLMVALETEFGIRFTSGEVDDLENAGQMLEVIVLRSSAA